MFNTLPSSTIFLILLIAGGIGIWAYNRAKSYGTLGILVWLQSVVLIVPWLILLGSYVLGIYLDLVTILFFVVAAAIVYIIIGNRLRAESEALRLRKPEKTAETPENETTSDRSATTPQQPDFNKVLPEVVPIQEADLQIVKGIFGIDTFFATETISYQEGAIFKGNLRKDPEIAHAQLSAKLKAALGEKYRLFLVESPEGKPVVIVLPSSNDPQPSTLAQKNLALVLLLATIFTTLVTASLFLDLNLFENFDRYGEALPITIGLWTIFIAREIGHRYGARLYNLRLSLPYFIPSLQIGSFGSIFRFESLIPHRSALFDVAIAGSAAGAIVSLLLLIFGLIISHPGSTFQIPTQLFQTSILVGTIAKIFLGPQMNQNLVSIDPLVVIGWLGLAICALNLMPAGQLNGGRIVQAIYGRKIARRTTIGTLILLGIISITNPINAIPLYWGILILFLQRDLERPALNELTEPNDVRAICGLLALLLMLLTLIPLSPSLAGSLGIGG